MKFLSFVALASMAMAAPSVKRAPTPLDVKLEMVGNSEVKATISNNGKNGLKLLKTGTILDDAPVEKAHVSKDGKDVDFDGLKMAISTEALDETAFQKIAAGQEIEITFNIAEVHDLSEGGKFDVSAAGILSYSEEDSNELVGSVAFESNHIEADVDGEEAGGVRIDWHQKRTVVQSDCTGTRLTTVQNALSVCQSLATAASTAATSGAAAKMTEFFKSSTTATRSTVATVFNRVATQCSSTTSGGTKLYCSDVYGACSNGVIAYTLPSASYMAYCPYFFNSMSLRGSGCYTQAQGNTIVHEATHLTQVKGTDDYGGYGYSFVRSLTAAQNLNHADTYTLFAQSLYAGC